MLKDKLTITQVMEMKHMGTATALLFAKQRYPQLDSSEMVELEQICNLGKPQLADRQTPAAYDRHRHIFISAMWLLGASQAQLGRKFNIAQQTVYSHLNRSLRIYPDRNAIRLASPPMDPERLESLCNTFYKMIAIDDPAKPFYTYMTPLELAAALSHIPTDKEHQHLDTDTPEGDYAELPDQTRKLVGEA